MRHALLRAGADTNSANSADNTGLMVACSMGHEARRFYRRTPIPTCMSNAYGITALMVACKNGHEATCFRRAPIPTAPTPWFQSRRCCGRAPTRR